MEHAVETGLGGVMGLLILAVIGLIIGAVAKALTPGPDPGGWFATILLGIAGSWVGSFLAGILGLGQTLATALVFAVLGSIILLLIYRMVRRPA
jgi:uncharacterized membrane protein YeaQ/YmgE (transglycosylase-associated protein family)